MADLATEGGQATLAGLVFLALAAIWLLAPTLLLAEWGVAAGKRFDFRKK